MKVEIADYTFLLDHRKVMYQVESESIIVADLHVGKSAHFRKAGVSMPGYSFVTDILKFQEILEEYQPKRVLILGDLYHSDSNEEFDEWDDLISQFESTQFVLVIGNHDRKSISHHHNIMEQVDFLEDDSIFYTHEPTDHSEKLNFCGHIHPGVRLSGSGRQSMKLSCFWLSKNRLVLPAFSELTGLGMIKPKRSDRIFIPLEEKVIEL